MSYETNDKMVSHPDHYKSGKYEVIDIIDEFTKDLSGTEAVCTANAIKYILRWKKKNGIQDVRKAIWYLQHMVDKEEERLQEEHAEFDEERLEKMEEEEDLEVKTCKECGYYNPICCFTGNNVKPDQLMCACFEEKGEEVLVPDVDKVKEFYDTAGKNCKTCKHENDINCGDNCNYPNLMDWEPKEVDMDKIMNPPYDELYKMNDNQKETINNLLREKKEMQDSIDILTDDKKSLQDLVRQLREGKKKKFINNTGEELDIPEFLEQPAEEEIHSCDDCVNKANEPWDDPCQSCDLHQNPPSKWVAES